MAKRTTKTATAAAVGTIDSQPEAAVSIITNTEGAPSAESAAPVAGPDPSEGAPSSTNVGGDSSEVQTTQSGEVADAGVTVAASVPDQTIEISGDLLSATGEVGTAEPEPRADHAGASSSTSAEAQATIAQTTETGEADGKDEADVLPAAGSTSDQVAEAFAAQAGLDAKTIEAIKTQILGLPRIERRKFLAYRTVRHDGVRTVRGGWLTLTMAAHASLAARDLVSKDWDNGVRAED